MGKACYYKIMAWMYGCAGSYADLAMVNSSWTKDHIMKLWGISERIVRVYPPCDTLSLQVGAFDVQELWRVWETLGLKREM